MNGGPEAVCHRLRQLAAAQGRVRCAQCLQMVQDGFAELVGPSRSGLGRHQRGQPAGGQRSRRGVVGLPREPERTRGGVHRGSVDLDPTHHLVLDLHQIGRVEELVGGEVRIQDRFGVRV